jgi:hypothetical protein
VNPTKGEIMKTLRDRPELIESKLEMFTKRRLGWSRPLDLPLFNGMPG